MCALLAFIHIHQILLHNWLHSSQQTINTLRSVDLTCQLYFSWTSWACQSCFPHWEPAPRVDQKHFLVHSEASQALRVLSVSAQLGALPSLHILSDPLFRHWHQRVLHGGHEQHWPGGRWRGEDVHQHRVGGLWGRWDPGRRSHWVWPGSGPGLSQPWEAAVSTFRL